MTPPNYSLFLKSLNKQQSLAVSHDEGSLAVIAGAGSGKTKVLTNRIAWLLERHSLSSQSILAVTFTNKAAQEMKKRLVDLGVPQVDDMWVGTFHGLAYRFLRRHHELAGLPRSFQILDASDQEKVMKKLFKNENIDPDVYDVKEVIHFINRQKDAGLRPDKVNQSDPQARSLTDIYAKYQAFCERSGWVDFGELILRCYEVTTGNEELKLRYQSQFKHVLVDEFQDTNDIQYMWVAKLCDNGLAIPATVVGDMDQSIYSWRGAKMTNVEKFIDEFAQAHMIKLEQNYRSTHHILSTANALIQQNRHRIDKKLWTQISEGEPVSLFEAQDDREEADWAVIQGIRQHKQTGKWSDTAILYRSNAQSRILEEACIKRNIPYKIYGGLRFFERAEIKDALSHLYVIEDIQNDLMLERALVSPTKGFGAKNLDLLREYASVNQLSYAQALQQDELLKNLSSKAKNAFEVWSALWEEQKKNTFHEQVIFSVEQSNLLAHYKKLDLKEGTDRAENLKELVSVATRFAESYKGSKKDILSDFLSSVSLESDTAQASTDALQLMTIHSSKGLEFPTVCCVGWDEGLFPSSYSSQDLEKLEEERRLAYVAITRAEKKLGISTTIARRQYGQFMQLPPSRFFHDLPASHCVWVRAPSRSYGQTSEAPLLAPPKTPLVKRNPTGESFWNVGDKVIHPQFGKGTIVRVDGLSKNDRVLVSFATEKKVLLPQLAKLQKA